MSQKLLRLNQTTSNIEAVDFSSATPSADGFMSSLDKSRLDYLVEHAAEKLHVGSVDGSLSEEIVSSLKFDLQKGFVVDLDTFNEAHISLEGFIRVISDGISSYEAGATESIVISGGPGIDVVADVDQKRLVINNTDKSFSYQSGAPSVLHTIDHNLGTVFLDYTVMVEDAVEEGVWRNDICRVKFVSQNTAEIWLTESANVIASFIGK